MIAFLLAQTIAMTGGTVYPVSGPKIENATVLIRDGRIAAVERTSRYRGRDPHRCVRKWVTPGDQRRRQYGIARDQFHTEHERRDTAGNDVAARSM
jgi:hypothetical protein